MTVDVAINVYGKPYETAVTLLSLLKHSGRHINKIYLTLEARQPRWSEYQFVKDILGDKLIQFVPRYWLWLDPIDKSKLGNTDYRHSIRYQYAWESTTADYLYLTHNDVLYTGDVIGPMLENIGDNIAIGQVGQCWNCPAFSSNLCDGDRYWNYRPDKTEALRLHREGPKKRDFDHAAWIEREGAWPLPECRLNEWSAMIDMRKARPETAPIGDAEPFGGFSLDIGTRWFQSVSRKGFPIKNIDISRYAIHDWTNGYGGGHPSLFDKSRYDRSESIARDLLEKEFDVSATKQAGPMAFVKNAALGFRATLPRKFSDLKRKLFRTN